MRWLGVDVGGANIKVSIAGQYANSHAFELWRNRDGLAAKLHRAFAEAPGFDAVAATMTGELADCYETKADGVRHICQGLVAAAASSPLAIYCVDGQFRTAMEVEAQPHWAAASNWHALARFAAAQIPGEAGVLIDVGSTTTDLIPISHGSVLSAARTDTDRLLAGELIYTGVGRTPVCAIVTQLPFAGAMCPVAAELFATTADVYRVLGSSDMPQVAAADGRSFDLVHCVDRLARQICTDRESFRLDDARVAAKYVHRNQLDLIRRGLDRVLSVVGIADPVAIVSGSGEPVAQKLSREHPGISKVISLGASLGEAQSGCAAALAVAWLAAKEPVDEWC